MPTTTITAPATVAQILRRHNEQTGLWIPIAGRTGTDRGPVRGHRLAEVLAFGIEAVGAGPVEPILAQDVSIGPW